MRGATPSGTEKKKRRPLGPAFSNPFDRQSPPRKKRQEQQPLGPAFANPFDQAQPPDRTLAHLGINKTVPEFNDALLQLHSAFSDAYRRPPSPGLALDVLRSPLEPHEFPKLFTVPESHFQAQMDSSLAQAGVLPKQTLPGGSGLVQDARVALRTNNDDWFRNHSDDLIEFISTHEGYRQFNQAITQELRKVNRAPLNQRQLAEHHLRSQQPLPSLAPQPEGGVPTTSRSGGTTKTFLTAEQEQQAGLISKQTGTRFGLAASQILSGLVHAPEGIYQTAKAPTLDTWDAARHGDFSFHNTRTLAKGIYESTKYDFEHSDQNPGNVLMAMFSGASMGAGALGRLGKLGEVAAAAGPEERAAALGLAKSSVSRGKALQRLGAAPEVPLTKGRALVRAMQKPRGGTFTMKLGDATVQSQPLSENSLWRAAQKLVYPVRQHRAQLRHELDVTQSPGLSPLLDLAGRGILDKYFSWPSKMGRELRRENALKDELGKLKAEQLRTQIGTAFEVSSLKRAISKHAPKLLPGLTRGENKAIQIMATPLPTWEEKVQWWKDFHHDMIGEGTGYPGAHEQQLKDISAAEHAMRKPSKRFQNALVATAQAVTELETQKMEDLGLSALTAKRRVVTPAVVLKGGSLTPEEAARISPASGFYSPYTPRKYGKRGPRFGTAEARRGAFGLTRRQTPGELTHLFTGESILSGDFRIDTGNMVADQIAKHSRYATAIGTYNKLWAAGRETPRLNRDGTLAKWQIPIRNVNDIPDELRRTMQEYTEGHVSKDTLAQFGNDTANVHKIFYGMDHEKALKGMEGKVRWVDERLVPSLAEWSADVPNYFTRALGVANEPLRDLYLYARPAYALNLPGNAAMLLWNQGLATPLNFSRALVSGSEKHGFGPKVTRWLDSQVYETKARALDAPKGIPSLSRAAGGSWSYLVDKHMRRAALIYHYRRKGIKTREDFERIMADPKRHEGLVNEVSRRGNKDMVEYNNLTPVERGLLRHLIFVYPWVSRASVWTIRSILEHPNKTLAAQLLGEFAQKEDDKTFKNVPEWFKKTGYITAGWQDGKPVMANPQSIWTPSTLAQMIDSARGTIGVQRYSSLSDVLAPGWLFYLHVATGRDQYGNDYQGSPYFGRILGAVKESAASVPLAAPLTRKKAKALPPISPVYKGSSKEALAAYARREAAAAKNPSFGEPFWGGWGSLVLGGFAPRTANRNVLAAKYWSDEKNTGMSGPRGGQDLSAWTKWHGHVMAGVRKQLVAQGRLLGKSAPSEVRNAIDYAGTLDELRRKWAQGRGHAPGRNSKHDMEIKVQALEQTGFIASPEAKRLAQQVKNVNGTTEQDALDRHLDSLAGAKALAQWDQDVQAVWSFRKPLLKQKLHSAAQDGIVSKKALSALLGAHPDELIKYGRGYLAWQRKIKAANQKSSLDVLIAAYESEHHVDGKFPPYERLDFTIQHPTAADRAVATAHLALKPWRSLTPFQQSLLTGKKEDGRKLYGYQQVEKWREWAKQNYQSSQYPESYLVKWINSKAPGVELEKDYNFSHQILAHRLTTYRVYKQMHPQVKLVVQAAVGWWKYYSKASTLTNARQGWVNHIQSPKFQAELAKHPKAIQEMTMLGGQSGAEGFMERLLDR